MGKKTKIGKQRKDKYYALAKETGYRSRAAFKLIQLNRKFEFLQKSRVCIDLCAAPGGWMQVAKQNMPVSSIVVGVDLYPIKPVAGCICLTEDITTDKCRTAITRELQTWKADIVLHDGAPNVGKNWLHDAYQQICLTLSAVKLATNFLRPGGWFVTKVFRSKDYNPLLWVLKQFFRKVHATKPQASRNESAEIFVVCQYYVAPEKIDPKLLNAKYVFQELDIEPENKLNVYHPEKQKAKAVGYPTNDYTLYHTCPVSQFVEHPNGIEILEKISQLVFDSKEIENHPKTTAEIKECCKDIKVLGRKDLRLLLAWWKDLHEEMAQKENEEEDENAAGTKITEIDPDKLNEEEIEKEIATLKEEELRELKRKRKRANKERAKLLKRMNLKMVLKGDSGPTMDADDMFNLKQMGDKKELNTITEQAPEVLAESDTDDDDDEKIKAKYMQYRKEEGHLDSSGLYYKDSESELEMESDEDSEPGEGLGLEESDASDDDAPATNDDDDSNKHPLITDLDYRDKKQKKAHKAELWFERDVFKNLISEKDEDHDLDRAIKSYDKKKTALMDESKEDGGDKKLEANVARDKDVEDNDTDTDSDSDYDVEDAIGKNATGKGKQGFDVVKQNKDVCKIPKKKRSLNDTELALGAMMVNSKRAKRELIDNAWNRYTFNDEHLPDWFVEDEKKYMKRNLPVTKEMVEEYKKRRDEINVRALKKVIEAKGRKKRRAKRKMERAKKKVEALLENETVDDREKTKQIKQLYKKAQAEPKKKTTYIVAKKHMVSGKRFSRPKHLKGRVKVVDPRMKKDLKGQKRADEKRKGTKKTKKTRKR